MIDLRNRYYITIAFRGIDGENRPELGDIVQANGVLFSVKLSRPRWVALVAAIKNKVEYIECLKKFKQDTPISVEDWYPVSTFENGVQSYSCNKYDGQIVFVGHREITSLP